MLKSSIKKLIDKIKHFDCPHYIKTANIKIIKGIGVETNCLKCGKLLKAPYGLALPGTFVKNEEDIGKEKK